MPAIAFDYPDEILALREGITDFIRKEVLPRHEKHHDLFADQRRKYEPDGRWSPAVWEILRRTVGKQMLKGDLDL